MKTRNVFAAFSMVGLLATLSLPATATVENSDIQSGQSETGRSNYEASEKHFEDEARKKHEVVARYYEDEARKTQAKARELRLLLEHYEEKSYLYGNKAQDLKSHTGALIRKYEEAAKADGKEAILHRQIATKLKEKNYTSSGTQRFSEVNE